jgi:hypothetical protein
MCTQLGNQYAITLFTPKRVIWANKKDIWSKKWCTHEHINLADKFWLERGEFLGIGNGGYGSINYI